MKVRAHRPHPTCKEPTDIDMDLLEKLPNFMISSNMKDPRENDLPLKQKIHNEFSDCTLFIQQ